jgi:hypothetical protein
MYAHTTQVQVLVEPNLSAYFFFLVPPRVAEFFFICMDAYVSDTEGPTTEEVLVANQAKIRYPTNFLNMRDGVM